MTQRSVYVGTDCNATGKHMVAIGMKKLAARRFGRMAFFHAVVHSSPAEDQSIRMMRSRYEITTPADEMFDATRAKARQMLADDRYSSLIQLVQQRFKTLEAKAEFVVVESTSYQSLAPKFEFQLSADIAANIGSRVLSVYAMANRYVDECISSLMIGNESFADRGAELIVTIINLVPDNQSTALKATIKTSKLDSKAPLYFLPDEPLLRRPTVPEIQLGIGAKLVSIDESLLDREVTVRKVAAMQLPGFLERLFNAVLVITPRDRSDIPGGCVLAFSQPDGPSPVTVVLTGGILLPPSIRRLIENANALPILVAIEDTHTVASKAADVRAEIGDPSLRKIESAIGLFKRHVDTDSLATQLQVAVVPRIAPMLFEHSLTQRARQ